MCLVGVDQPTETAGVLPILASHFETTCAATSFMEGPTSFDSFDEPAASV